MCACGDQRPKSCVLLCLQHALSLSLDLADSLEWQVFLGAPVSLGSWDCRHVPLHQLFRVGAGNPDWSPSACETSTLLT